MSLIIEIANAVIELFIAIFFFGNMLNQREMKNFYKVISVFGVLIVHIARSFVPIDTYINIAITSLLWGLLIVVLYNDLFLKKIATFVLYFVSVFITDIICRFTMSCMMDAVYGSHATTPGLERYIGMCLTSVILFSVLSIFVTVSKQKSMDVTLKYRAMMALFPLFSLFIVISLDAFIMISGISDIRYIFALLLVVVGLLYFNIMTFEFMDTYSSKIRLAAAEELIKNQVESYQLLEINENELRRLRHNICKHIEVMKEMIKQNAFSETMELSESLENLSILPTSIIYTGDIALDSILNVESKSAAKYGIKYLVKAHNLTRTINIPAIDKSTILCNAINNAIEACQKLGDREKFIVIDISSNENKVRIHIENSSLPQKVISNHILTSKKDLINHGFGIDSIKKTIEKYDGVFNISYSNGVTTCCIEFENL